MTEPGRDITEIAEELWRQRLVLLREYIRENSGKLPRYGVVFRGVYLGSWVVRMRQRYWAGLLLARAVDDMEAIPEWTWGRGPVRRPRMDNGEWQRFFVLLQQFIHEHGRIPTMREEYRGAGLGSWVGRQRTAFKSAWRSLTAERRAALEAVPGWTWGRWRGDNDLVWHYRYEALRRYTETHGRLPRVAAVVDGENLGSWIRLQRRVNKGLMQGVLTPERRAKLEALRGWRW